MIQQSAVHVSLVAFIMYRPYQKLTLHPVELIEYEVEAEVEVVEEEKIEIVETNNIIRVKRINFKEEKEEW